MACNYLNFYKYFLHFELLASNTIKNKSIHLTSWHHSHKKQKNSLETQVVFVDIFAWTWNIWGDRTENTSKQRKMVVFVRNCLVKISLRLFYSISVVITLVPVFLWQFRRLAQGHWNCNCNCNFYSYTYVKKHL